MGAILIIAILNTHSMGQYYCRSNKKRQLILQSFILSILIAKDATYFLHKANSLLKRKKTA